MSVSISLGADLRDDFLIDVEGLTKGEVRAMVVEAITEALKRSKKCTDFTVCN